MSTDIRCQFCMPEIWGGIECTINRVENNFQDQLVCAGHYERQDDIEQFARLGIKAIRYPVLWERNQPAEEKPIDWSWAERQLEAIRGKNIKPIVGLVHHGSGPAYTNLLDPLFPEKLMRYAQLVAAKFPWVEFYTPINEPHTTARFSGLYGLWYPHHRDNKSYALMFLNQLKGIVLAMQAIRQVNPNAKLIQTEDLSKTHSTSLLQYQADFENKRRWLTYDILCGRFNNAHPLWSFFISLGITESQLNFFIENPCIPHIMGFNYYVTSERFLDEKIDNYPQEIWGGNGRHQYVDVEAVRHHKIDGLGELIKQAWSRFKLPIAITEVHLNCTREEQMRWFYSAWKECCIAAENGVNVIAVTAWSLLGAFDWVNLLTCKKNHYEPGVFNISNKILRKTAVGKMISDLATKGSYSHPVLKQKGWWQGHNVVTKNTSPPVLIIGKNGTLATAFANACANRSIDHLALSRNELDICDKQSVAAAIERYKPWAIINTAGYVRVDDAETEAEKCFAINTNGPVNMAMMCAAKGIKFMTFSSDLVFDGTKTSPYVERDLVNPLNIYGQSKASCEKKIMEAYADALVIRTSAFFSPIDKYNFAHHVLSALANNERCEVLNDVYVSPTYVPDLVNASLDLFIDDESNIWHLTNDGNLTWADFAKEIAERGGYQKTLLVSRNLAEMGLKAKRPIRSSLKSTKGVELPVLTNALERFFHHKIY